MKTCTLEGCDKQPKRRGYCPKHWSRVQRHGNPHVCKAAPGGRICELDGCDRPHQAKGYCRKHYQRINYKPRAAERITGGVEHNTTCMKRGGCNQPPEGGGVYCLRHFWTEVVIPGKQRRGEL